MYVATAVETSIPPPNANRVRPAGNPQQPAQNKGRWVAGRTANHGPPAFGGQVHAASGRAAEFSRELVTGSIGTAVSFKNTHTPETQFEAGRETIGLTQDIINENFMEEKLTRTREPRRKPSLATGNAMTSIGCSGQTLVMQLHYSFH
jgi:hypothetical protein